MSKKTVSILLLLFITLSVAGALASQTIPQNISASYVEVTHSGQRTTYTQTMATATHNYAPKNNSNNTQYTGATKAATTIAKKGVATSASINTQPNFTATVSNAGKTLKVTYSSGQYKIVFPAQFNVAQNGTRTPAFSGTQVGPFSGTKTHNK